jgi:large subunit ribosomal protein L1
MSSKRYRKALEMVDATKRYTLEEALEILKKLPPAKFDQTVDMAFKLGVDPRQSDQMVRGTVLDLSSKQVSTVGLQTLMVERAMV